MLNFRQNIKSWFGTNISLHNLLYYGESFVPQGVQYFDNISDLMFNVSGIATKNEMSALYKITQILDICN